MIDFAGQLPSPLPFVDTVPQWLGPVLLLIGTASLILWASQYAVDRLYSFNTANLQVVVLLSVVLGIVFTSLGALSEAGYVDQFSIMLVAAGRFVEGGAVIRGIRKLHYMITQRPFLENNEDLSTQFNHLVSRRELPSSLERFRPKIRYRLIQAGIGLTAVGIYIAVLWVNGLTQQTLYAVVLTWTLSVFMLAVLGLSWKLEYAEDQLSPSLIIGLLAASAGAQVYNHVNLVWDITGILVGTAAFLAGIVVGAVAVLLS